MLPPHELKGKDFTRVVRGYNPVEVDEHIKFIIEKYTELYRENDELERKLKTANARLEQFKSDEESIRSALINAQRASAKITTEANERAEIIIRSAKTSCDRIIASRLHASIFAYSYAVPCVSLVWNVKQRIFGRVIVRNECCNYTLRPGKTSRKLHLCACVAGTLFRTGMSEGSMNLL